MLLANAKTHTVYTVHIDYGPNPASTRMDYISEFTVTMPILSLTGTSECLSDTKHFVEVYCIQTQAIQQYSLDLSQCLPPSLDSGALENGSSFFPVCQTAVIEGLAISECSQTTPFNEILAGSPLLKSNLPVNSSKSTTASRDTAFSSTMEELAGLNTENMVLTLLSSSNADVEHLSSPSVFTPDVHGKYLDFRSSSKKIEQGPSHTDLAFDHMVADLSNERKIQGADSIDDVVNFARQDARCGSNDVAVVQNSAGLYKASNNVMHLLTSSEIKSGIVMSYENNQDEIEKAVRDVEANKDIENVEVEVKVVSESGARHNGSDSQKEKVLLMQEALNDQVLQQKVHYDEIIAMLKEMQKRLSICTSIPTEIRRLEASLGRNMEKLNKANADAITDRFREDGSKLEKNVSQQIANLMTTSISKKLSSVFEITLKKELATVGQAVARVITPVIEKCLSPEIAGSFQSVSTKLNKSVSTKLEATVARQIQEQFLTSGKQALQETLRSTVESLVVPAFEQSCKAMFEQVDATFQKGMFEYTGAFQKQF